MLKLDSPESVTYPRIQIFEYLRGLCQPEVGLSAAKVYPHLFGNLGHALTSTRLVMSLGFLLVHAQMQLLIHLAHPTQYSFARLLTANVHVAVVGVPGEAMAALLQRPIYFVQQHVGQQQRQWTALRHPLVTRYYHTIRHDPCL